MHNVNVLAELSAFALFSRQMLGKFRYEGQLVEHGDLLSELKRVQ